jgi:hypothetical protein
LPQRNRSGPIRFSRTVHLDGFTAMRMAVVLAGVLLAVGRPALSQEWTTFVEPEFGTRLELPSDIFTVHEGPSYRGTGEQYKTNDGRAELAVYSQENARHETPRSYLKRHNRAPRGTVDYMRVTRSFFAISALYDGVIYYSRCNFSRRSRNTIHCFDLKYPASEKLAWDKIVTRISRSLEPLDRG